MKYGLILWMAISSPLFACEQENEANALVVKTATVEMSQDLSRQQAYLEKALTLCPHHLFALNNLGFVYEKKGQWQKALSYYKTAQKISPKSVEPWLGMGDVYQKMGQLPQALEAYLNACQQDKEVKEKILALLEGDRYRNIEDKQVLNKQSLLILFDKSHQQAILTKVKQCHLKVRARMELTASFRNFHFASGSAILQKTNTQLDEIAGFLTMTGQNIEISGHTDKQPFRGKSQNESIQLNRQLSLQRAEALKQALVQKGVATSQIKTAGFGSDRLLDTGVGAKADKKNRRVEIKVY